jgi:hypothetical protein
MSYYILFMPYTSPVYLPAAGFGLRVRCIRLREETMIKTVSAVVVALSLASLATQASAQTPNQNGQGTTTAQLVKDCSEQVADNYGAWSYCTVTSSNISQIPPNSSAVYYTSSTILAAPFVPGLGLVDSNVVLVAGDAGDGNLATGRCTYDYQSPTNVGYCQYTGGIGDLAGFTASLVVTPLGDNKYSLTGPYQFKRASGQQN